MIDKAIKVVYDNIIDIILNDIEQSDKEEIAKNYLEYLYSIYSKQEINDSNFDSMIKTIINIEKLKWNSRDMNSKLYYLKKDDSFDIISSISKKAYSLALKKLQDKSFLINKQEADNDINTMIKALDNVQSFNKEEAKRLVSEGILDLKFISDGNENIKSFRIGHLK